MTVGLMSAEAWAACGVIATALAPVLVALIRTHRATEALRKENSAQHGQSYGLLQSIDARTMHMDKKLDSHGERIAALEYRVDDAYKD